MPHPDLVAEHAALLKEQTELRKLCLDEWLIMPAQVGKERNARLWQIVERLQVIERSKQWRYRNA